MDFVLQLLAVAMLVKITQKTTTNGCHIHQNFVPATVFHFVVLTVQIHITSGLMNYFVMFRHFSLN